MEMKEIEELMHAGDLREAASALREKIQIDAENSRAKVLLGVCLHLLGDEEESSKIDRELVDEVGVEKTDVRKFHALKVAASCAMMVLVTSTAYGSYGGTEPLYGVFCQSYRVSVVLKPTEAQDSCSGSLFRPTPARLRITPCQTARSRKRDTILMGGWSRDLALNSMTSSIHRV